MTVWGRWLKKGQSSKCGAHAALFPVGRNSGIRVTRSRWGMAGATVLPGIGQPLFLAHLFLYLSGPQSSHLQKEQPHQPQGELNALADVKRLDGWGGTACRDC